MIWGSDFFRVPSGFYQHLTLENWGEKPYLEKDSLFGHSLFRVLLHWIHGNNVKGNYGCLPFSQKIRKFRFEIKWNGNFPENLFGNCRQPPKVVLFFRSERNSRNALTICENPSVSRPFLTRSSKICGMECCVVNGKRHSHPVGH